MNTTLLKPLTKEQEDAALADVGYTREQLKADLKQIKEWLESQEHLPPSRLKENDCFLEQYLIGCKGSLEKVKRKLDCYYTIRGYSEIYDDRDPIADNYRNIKEMCEMAVMPGAMADGTRVLLETFVDKDVDKFSYVDYNRFFFNRMDIFIRNAGFSTKLYLIYDCNGVSPSVLLKLKPSIIRDALVILQDALPVRYVKMIGINIPNYMEITVNKVVKPFLSRKLKERFLMYGTGYEEPLKDFSPSMLPRDYGGLSTNPSLKEYSDRWSKYEEANREWFLNELSEKNDETKRSSVDSISENPYFGAHGSIKKLVID